MALTRKALKAMNLTDEQVESVMEMHIEVKDGLVDQLKQAQAKANQYEKDHLELEGIKAKGDDGYKDKYENEHRAFENYKAKIANEKLFAKQTESYKEVLKDAKISNKYVPTVVKASKDVIASIEYDEKDNIKNKDDLITSVKDDWEVFVESTRVDGADPPEPPESDEGDSFESRSLAEKMEYANQHPNDPQVTAWLSK